MPWKRDPKVTLGHEHDLRVARSVVRQLRAMGFHEAKLHDLREEGSGARLWPANVQCGKGWVLVRRLGVVLPLSDRAWMRSNQPCMVQYGSADLGELVRWARALRLPYWLSTKD